MFESLSLLIKPASGACNMRCKYCFYADVGKNRSLANHGQMSLETLELIIQKALAETQTVCSFTFQGGEPALAGLDFYQRVIQLQQKHNHHRIQILNSIQTNGQLINDKWAQFFTDHNFLVGLSIDGPADLHDLHRLNYAGQNTFSRCLSAADIMTHHQTQFNILTVLTKPLAQEPEKVYHFYKKYHFHFIQFIPCLDGLDEPHDLHPYSLDKDTYAYFLKTIYDLWEDDFKKDDYYSIRQIDNWIQMLMGNQPENCGMQGVCQSYPVIEADGSIYPCDFYAIDEYLLGNIHQNSFTEMLTSQTSQAFMKPSLTLQTQCKKCSHFDLCRGGCRRDREPIKKGQTSLNYYCAAYQDFFNYARPKMKKIAVHLKQNQSKYRI